jgi:hypothetical protein
MQLIKLCCGLLISFFVSHISANGQRYEITPLVGGMYGGTLNLEKREVSPNFDARVENSVSFGIAGGFRFSSEDADDCDRCDLVEFRWMRQNTHLNLKQDPLLPTPVTTSLFRPAVTLDHFLGDFTHEWTLPDAKKIRPFITASLGAARMSTPASSAMRFAFGIGTGVKIFFKPRWGIRFEVEYLPTVLHAELQRLVCTGGCVVVLNGGVMNQIQLSIGPAFRF